MPYLTLVTSSDGKREIVNQDVSRASHLAIYKSIVEASPAEVTGVEIWNSTSGRARHRVIDPVKDAPALKTVLEEHKKATAEAAERIKKAIAADAKAAEGPSTLKPSKPKKKAAKKSPAN